jgi:release factor glutamine methyltransferase
MPVEKGIIAELLRLGSMLEGDRDRPRHDLEVMLCHELNKQRSYLFTWPEKVPNETSIQQCKYMLKRRAEG